MAVMLFITCTCVIVFYSIDARKCSCSIIELRDAGNIRVTQSLKERASVYDDDKSDFQDFFEA